MADIKGPIAVIGAGIIGCAVAYALSREGRKVVIFDRAAPGMGGASYGNVGHIASELIEPLPSPNLLFNFWRELAVFDGPLEVPMRHWLRFLPWAFRFARAAFHREENTRALAPLVRDASTHMAEWLQEVGRPELLRRNGHYEIWLDAKGHEKADAQRSHMEQLQVSCVPAPPDVLEAVKSSAKAEAAAGVWFPDTAHVLDPLEVVKAFFQAAVDRGATFRQSKVSELRKLGDDIEILGDGGPFTANAAVVCAGAWSASLLEPFGLSIPLEAANGYHVELPGTAPLVDAPLLYANERVLITPMASRLRASSYMEFGGADSVPDLDKSSRLRTTLRQLGYECDDLGPTWKGPRPVLPDYLPAIGKAHDANVFYATGHQHIGLTTAPITGEVVADLVARREPRLAISAFDVRRFAPSFGETIPPHG